jgi:hypothetical protein
MRLLRRSSLLSLLLGGSACGEPAEIEGGLQSAECSDGLDNDQNGRADCDEPTCAQALACKEGLNEQDTDPGDDTGDLTGDKLISATGDCDLQGYFYEVKISGRGVGPELYIYDTVAYNPWNEFHYFPNNPIEESSTGAWELYYLELDSVSDVSEVEESETTLFQCDELKNLTWLVFVYDENLRPVECAVWGDDPESANDFWGTDCPTL